MSQKQGESEGLHFSVDLAAKFLWLNSACLEVQNVQTRVPRISQSGNVSIAERQERTAWTGFLTGLAFSLAQRYGSITTSMLTAHNVS